MKFRIERTPVLAEGRAGKRSQKPIPKLTQTSQQLLADFDELYLFPQTAPADYPLSLSTLLDFLEFLEIPCKLKVPAQVTEHDLHGYIADFDEDGKLDPGTVDKLERSLREFYAFMKRPRTRKEVSKLAKSASMLPTPPKMTRADWLKRDKAKVTLTRGELDQLARLVTAGRALLRNEPSISPTLRTAMTKLGLDTKGL